MHPEEFLPPVAQKARAEHKRLHARLSALRGHGTDNSQSREVQRTLIVAELAELRRLLAAHFEFEELGGWLEEAACRIPRLSAALVGLECEHRKILDNLDRLVRLAELPDLTAAEWEGLLRDIDSVAVLILRHEEAEEQILQQGFNRDLETTD